MSTDAVSSSCDTAPIRIRSFVEDDREFVFELSPRLIIGLAPWRDSALMLVAMQRFIHEDMDAMGEESTIFVAENAQGTRLGFVTVGRNVNFSGEVQAYVGELVVSEDVEGTGIGRALMEAAENWARTKGYGLVVLDTGAANTSARAFYQRLGYREESVRLVKVFGE